MNLGMHWRRVVGLSVCLRWRKPLTKAINFLSEGRSPWEVKASALYYPLSDCGKGWDLWELHLFTWITLFPLNKYLDVVYKTDLASALAKLRSLALWFRDFIATWGGVNTFCSATQCFRSIILDIQVFSQQPYLCLALTNLSHDFFAGRE